MNIGLVWATNVGKSTLFNRLIGQFRAIVTDIPGTTIDILKHETEINGLGQITFSDSPGLLEFKEERPFIQQIIDESDIILFIIDDNIGITAKEQEIFAYIIESGKKRNTILIVNKLDTKRKLKQYDLAISEYYELGFPEVIGISAKKKHNLSQILETIKKIPPTETMEQWDNETNSNHPESSQSSGIQIAIIGKPNAGKSTLLNTIIGKPLAKIEDKAGTTRDYVMGKFKKGKQEFHLYDTAGIRKKWRMRNIEKIAYQKTLAMLKYIKPMVIFLIDAQEGISHRDMSLLHEITDIQLPLIITLNKTDLLGTKQLKSISTQTQKMFDFAKYIPIVPIIATNGKGTQNLFKMIKSIHKESHKRIETTPLNKAITHDRVTRPPRFPKNKVCKIFYTTQIEIDPPTFMCFINHKARANFAFRKRLDNTIRLHFGFVGAPLRIFFKQRKETDKPDAKDYKKNYERKRNQENK